MNRTITPENITQHELVGLDVAVTGSTNPQLIGLNGSVLDETKSMIIVMTECGRKMIPKGTCTFEFNLGGRMATVDGATMTRRPFDRIGAKA